ncbi:XK-related protein 5 isoform X1 [Coturnix japonica]|uniref:XK-related protein 5 isoform X1 n=1 Tax=Coturnix japonica TaxID=93934 RepID=UPI000776D751|nr:XK-related protein 5 isoform X1 [Coturnix japonica]
MRGVFPALCLALLAAERGARLCTIIHYLSQGQLGWFCGTITCLVPGYVAQLLSVLWLKADGHPPGCRVLVLHILQFGLWKRYWDILWMEVKANSNAGTGEMLMQHADVCVLRLLEALLQSLPHLLLQLYVVVVSEPASLIPAVSAGLSLLSLCWALVSYSRSCCLLRPGHVCLPAAALLCLLLWRMGMLTSRVLALLLFARLYSCWVLAVAGTHWLLMSFWLVALQSDIVAQPCRWRLFNVLMGAVYIFCYINVQPGPSKHRMAVFYVVMLMENTLLLLLATEFLQAEMGHSLRVSGAAMAGAALGVAAMVLYYSLFHPKSSKIRQGILETSSCAGSNDQAAGNSSCMGQSWGTSIDGESLAAERTTITPQTENSPSPLQLRASSEDGWTNHHHWLLVKLALKTGNVSKINAAFGNAGVGELYIDGREMGTPQHGAEPSLPTVEIAPLGLELGLLEEKSMVVRNGGGSKHEVGAGRNRGGQEAAGHPATPPPHCSSASLPEGSSVYFSASTGGITSPGSVMVTATSTAPLQGDSEAHSSPGCLAGGRGRREDFSLETASISPILASHTHRHLQSDVCMGTEGAPVGWHHLQDTHPCGTQGVVGLRSKLRPPRFTSTPKADSKCSQRGLRDVGEGKDVS